MTTNLIPVTCTCGSTIRRNRNGQAVCRTDRKVITMESLLVQGIAPMWSAGTLVTHA